MAGAPGGKDGEKTITDMFRTDAYGAETLNILKQLAAAAKGAAFGLDDGFFGVGLGKGKCKCECEVRSARAKCKGEVQGRNTGVSPLRLRKKPDDSGRDERLGWVDEAAGLSTAAAKCAAFRRDDSVGVGGEELVVVAIDVIAAQRSSAILSSGVAGFQRRKTCWTISPTTPMMTR